MSSVKRYEVNGSSSFYEDEKGSFVDYEDYAELEAKCVSLAEYVRADVVAGNSPVIPDGWVACSERMPEPGRLLALYGQLLDSKGDPYGECDVDEGYLTDGKFYVFNWNYPGPIGDTDENNLATATHWMYRDMPAAPKQDIKPVGGSSTYHLSANDSPPERGYVVTCDGADHFYRDNQEAQKHVMDAIINRRSVPAHLVTLEQVPARIFSEVRSFGYLRAEGAGDGLRVVMDCFQFAGGTAPTDKVVSKYLLQGVINYMQEYCDTLSEDDSRVLSIFEQQGED